MHLYLLSLKAQDCISVIEYLDHRDFQPNLLSHGTSRGRLSDVEGDKKKVSQAVIQCGTLYLVARKLSLQGLQDLCFRKLQALGRQSHLLAPELILIAKPMFSDWSTSDKCTRAYFAEYFATHYFEIWEEQPSQFRELQRDCKELAVAIHGCCARRGGWREEKGEEEVQEIGRLLTDFSMS